MAKHFAIRAGFYPPSKCINEDEPLHTFNKLSDTEVERTLRCLRLMYDYKHNTRAFVTATTVNDEHDVPVVAIFHILEDNFDSSYAIPVHEFFKKCVDILAGRGIRERFQSTSPRAEAD